LKEDGEQSNRHLEDVLKMVQKSISKEIGWLPATKIDWESLDAMKKRIEENIEILEEEKATNMEERIKAEKNKLTKKDVTEKDVTESGNKINLTFKKIFDEEKQKSIFVRPCHQTIEWRSTLMNFIRFEKNNGNFSRSFSFPVKVSQYSQV
jgi:UTP:GlnB (protein PII) uridylyltransferase